MHAKVTAEDILISKVLYVDPNKLLIYATHRVILSLKSNKDDLTDLPRPNQILNMSTEMFEYITSDVRNNNLYVTNLGGNYKGIVKINVNDTGKPEMIVDVGIYTPIAIAFDWITRNVYFAEYKLNHIAVCAPLQTQCGKVIIDDVSDTSSSLGAIALHPNAG